MKKDANGKLCVEVIIVSCLKVVASVGVLTASNTDVKLSETRTVRFSRIKSSSRFERTNKLDHFALLRNHVTLLLSHQC